MGGESGGGQKTAKAVDTRLRNGEGGGEIEKGESHDVTQLHSC